VPRSSRSARSANERALDLAPEHRSERGELAQRGRQALEVLADRGAHGLGNGELAVGARALRIRRTSSQANSGLPSLVRWIASIVVASIVGAGELRDLRTLETARRDHASRAREAIEEGADLGRHARLRRAVRAHDRERGAREVRCDEGEQIQRRQVGAVQILEHDRDGTHLRGHGQVLQRRVEQREAIVGDGRGRTTEHPRELAGHRELGSLAAQGADDLDPQPERRCTARLPAPAQTMTWP